MTIMSFVNKNKLKTINDIKDIPKLFKLVSS